MGRKRITLDLTESEQTTLNETIEIAVGEAAATLVQHQTQDGPDPEAEVEQQVDAYQQQIELVTMQEQRIADLDEIQGQLRKGRHDGSIH